MNKKGIFGFVITLVIVVMVVWIWAIIVAPAVNPSIDTTLAATANDPHSDGIGFFLRMIPWLVPIMFAIGLVWLGVSQ